MVPGKLVHLIETHGDAIIGRVIDEIRRRPEMAQVRVLLEPELREWREDLIENLGHWLRTANELDLANRYEHRGKQHFEDGVPLHECVRVMAMLHESMIDYVEGHIASKETLELYAEEELERRLSRFFDLLVIYFVRGYERAMRNALRSLGEAG
jgi:hypothetical protein